MKIELKNIRFSEAMSEETNAFTADLYVNGKKIGYCKNQGHGGCTDYYGIEKASSDDIQKAEAYCKALPKTKWKDMEFDQSLESVIDGLLEDYLKAKKQKKLEKRMQTAIIWGIPNGDNYMYIDYKIPLEKLSKTAPKTFQKRINQIKKDHCKDGVVILNTNLEALGVNI
jgi:hypothetical protein